MNNAALVAEYRAYLESWASKQTCRLRLQAARSYLEFVGSIDNISAETVRAYIAKPKRDGQPKSTWSKATYHAHLKSFGEFLEVAGYVEANPVVEVRSVKRPRKAPRPLTEVQVQQVLAAAEGDVRDWIVIALATGLRVSEISRIRGEDVSEEGIYVEGKGEVAVTLPAHPDLLEMSTRMARLGFWWPGDDEGHVNPHRITRRVGDLFRSLGIKGSIHRCRHTYGTRLIRMGNSVRTVQEMMRHASLETTAGYSAVGEDEKQKAILTLPRALGPDMPPAA